MNNNISPGVRFALDREYPGSFGVLIKTISDRYTAILTKAEIITLSENPEVLHGTNEPSV